MPLSRPQIIRHFRPMVDKAWLAHCQREDITDSTHASKDEWYRSVLKKRLNVSSSNGLDASKGFEQAMAIFEELADDGIFWQMQLTKGDAKRARYLLDETVKLLRLTDDYIAAIMNRMGLEKPLRNCTAVELLNLRIALLKHVRRKQERTLVTSKSRTLID